MKNFICMLIIAALIFSSCASQQDNNPEAVNSMKQKDAAIQLNYETRGRDISLTINDKLIPLESSGTTTLFTKNHPDKSNYPDMPEENFILSTENKIELTYGSASSSFFNEIILTFYEPGQKYPQLFIYVPDKTEGKLAGTFKLGGKTPQILTNQESVTAIIPKAPVYSAIQVRIDGTQKKISPSTGILILNELQKGEQELIFNAILDEALADAKKIQKEDIEILIITPTGSKEVTLSVNAGEQAEQKVSITI